MYNRHLPFWLFAISSIILLTLSVLIQDGMFMDAVLYTSVAHNESIGFGTFWFPQYSTLNIAGLSSFHEQPPLVFGIVSLFFRALGDSIYVERLYTFLTMCITMLLMAGLWNQLYKREAINKKYIWFVYIIWISIPCIYWAYSNNMCENTMGIFALASVLQSYKALESQKARPEYWFLSGLLIFLATMSKGFPGFFPICVPILYYFIVKKEDLSRILISSTFLTAIPLICYGILFCFPVSRESLSIYLFKRAFHRIGSMPTVEYRLDIIYRLFCQLIPPLLIIAIIFLFARRRNKDAGSYFKNNKRAWFFIAVGSVASCPLALTLVQKDLYLIPSFPYIAIGMASLSLPFVSKWVEAIDVRKQLYRWLLISNIVLFIFSIGFLGWRYGQVNREQDVIHDVYVIGKVVPKFSTVTVPAAMYDEYNFILHGFLMRYDNISISPYKQYDYFLVEKTMKTTIPPTYTLVQLPTMKYDLYRRVASK